MGARAANGNIEYNPLQVLNHILYETAVEFGTAYFHTPRFRYVVSLVFFYPSHKLVEYGIIHTKVPTYFVVKMTRNAGMSHAFYTVGMHIPKRPTSHPVKTEV